MRPILIILFIFVPSAISSWSVSVPCTIGEMVETSEYVEYWKARQYHGNYISWYENGKWWFERDGYKIEYRVKN